MQEIVITSHVNGVMRASVVVTHVSGHPVVLTFEEAKGPTIVKNHVGSALFDLEAAGATYFGCAIVKIDGRAMTIGYARQEP